MTQYTDINIYKKIGVIPTDTIYGIVGQALDVEMVEKIYKIKGRKPDKPFIILISGLKDLERFDIFLTDEQVKILKRLWPNKVSVILTCHNSRFRYLHRGTNSLAFRLPKDIPLKNFIKKTGPLVAPSANPEGREAARNIAEAKKYFGDSLDFYIDAGEIASTPSTLVELVGSRIKVLRQGDFEPDFGLAQRAKIL